MINKIKSLKSNQEFMKYFNNTSWLFFDKIFKMGVGFFIIVYLTRYLGPERFGILSYAQSFVSIFMAFSSLGIGTIIVREMVKNPEKQNILLGTTFYLTLISSLIAISIIFLFNNILLKNEEITRIFINIISFTIIFQNFNMIIEMYFRTKVKLKYVVFVTSIGFIISSVLKLLLIYFNVEFIYFAYALIFDIVLLAIGNFYIYKRHKQSIHKWQFDWKLAKTLLNTSWPLILVAVSAFIYTRTDQIMIKHMISNEAVGNYAAAIKVSELFNFIPGMIATSLFPKIVELREVNKEKYFYLLENLYRIVAYIAIVIAIVIYFFRNEIIFILYGSQYHQASSILSILAFSIVFSSIGAIFVKILYVEHFEKKYMYKSVFGVVLNIVLNYILIKSYGVEGAAIATLLTLFSINYIYDFFDKDLKRFYMLKVKCFIPYVNFRRTNNHE